MKTVRLKKTGKVMNSYGQETRYDKKKVRILKTLMIRKNGYDPENSFDYENIYDHEETYDHENSYDH